MVDRNCRCGNSVLNLFTRTRPDRKYLPDCQDSDTCNANTGEGAIKSQNNSKLNIDTIKEVIPFTDCFTSSEDTRLSNPPSTLRGTGINRWEWLCKNPQTDIEEPFDYQISSRILSKINWSGMSSFG